MEGFEYPISCFLEGKGQWIFEEIKNYVSGASKSLNEDLESGSDLTPDSEEEAFSESISEIDLSELVNTDLFEKIFFQKEGDINGDSWIFVALHENGYYILFDYTENQDGSSGGLFYYTKSASDMYEFGFDSWTRDLIPDFLEKINLD